MTDRPPNNGNEPPQIGAGRTMSEKASHAIETYILEQGLTPGAKIPSEREIGLMLGVSRTVVREAVRLLVARGLLASRTGSGTYLKKLAPDRLLSEPMAMLLRNGVISAQHVLEARNLVEPEISALAAQRATGDDVLSLGATIDVIVRPGVTNEECARADVGFPLGLATTTDNPLLQAILVSFDGVMYDVCLKSYVAQSEPREQIHRHHMAILASVRDGDPIGARRHMETHLRQTAVSSKLLYT